MKGNNIMGIYDNLKNSSTVLPAVQRAFRSGRYDVAAMPKKVSLCDGQCGDARHKRSDGGPHLILDLPLQARADANQPNGIRLEFRPLDDATIEERRKAREAARGGSGSQVPNIAPVSAESISIDGEDHSVYFSEMTFISITPNRRSRDDDEVLSDARNS